AGASESTRRRRRRQSLEIAVLLKRSASNATGRRHQQTSAVSDTDRIGQITGGDRSSRQAAAIGTAAGEHAFKAVGDDADAYAGAIDRCLLSHDVSTQ